MKKYVQIITTDDVTTHIYKTSNTVAGEFHREFGVIIDDLATDLAISFTILLDAMDRDSKNELSDADYQSVHFFWSALNTIVSALELFIRGYSKEPSTLVRNALEIASAACDLHINPQKLSKFQSGKFESTKSIGVVKKVIPAIGPMYGQLSDIFAHLSLLYTLPQGKYKTINKKMWIGGGFSEEHKEFHLITLGNIVMTTDIVNSLLEYVLYKEITDRRFWVDQNGFHHFKPLQRIKDRSSNIAQSMNNEIQNKHKT